MNGRVTHFTLRLIPTQQVVMAIAENVMGYAYKSVGWIDNQPFVNARGAMDSKEDQHVIFVSLVAFVLN